jgi:hypothetical protein
LGRTQIFERVCTGLFLVYQAGFYPKIDALEELPGGAKVLRHFRKMNLFQEKANK